MKRIASLLCGILALGVLSAFPAGAAEPVLDAFGKPLSSLPWERILCSGSGCLRLATYLQVQDRAVGVEDIERRHLPVDPRPYFLAHRELQKLPLIGEFRGFTRPELVLALPRQPQGILKTDPENGTPARKLQEATGIPVLPLKYGNLTGHRDDLYASLRALGRATGRQTRAEEVIRFTERTIQDLARRTRNLPPQSQPRCYVGGVSFRGAHGLLSTETDYPPFVFLGVDNVVTKSGAKGATRTNVNREDLLRWNPRVLFVDLSTLGSPAGTSALDDLRSDPLWRDLAAVREGRVYGVLPYNWYTQNFECILANAYFVGKVLFPERFRDVDPRKKADEIFRFFVGKPVFAEMDRSFQGQALRRLSLR